MIIRVTATVGLDYDTADGPVTTIEDAIEDIRTVIDNGEITAAEYTVTTEVVARTQRVKVAITHMPTDAEYPWHYNVDTYNGDVIDYGSMPTEEEAIEQVAYVLANRERFDNAGVGDA